jgi:REP element-mobilizing transposase RayT
MLNQYGQIVEKKLDWLMNQYFYVEIDSSIVMPNHIHAIIIIDPTNVGTSRDLSLQSNHKIKSLSELVGAFKTVSSKAIHLAGLKEFKWQRSFYDRIIRNEKELYNIRTYIQQNPLKWDIEKSLPENLDIL